MPRKLPDEIIPILETVQRRVFSRDTPLDFWRIDHGPSILNGFMDLASQLQLSVFDGNSPREWPGGYVMVTALFNWEAASQADGYSQYFERSDSEIDGICMMFKHVGLPDEAESIRRAREAAVNGSNLDAVAKAYRENIHEYSVDLDRLEFLTQWFCDGGDEFFYHT